MLSKLVDTFFSLLGLLAHQKIILADTPLSVQISILKCLVHCFYFFQNLLLCSANQPQLFNIHVFIFHTLDKLLNIGINSLGSHYLGGGINQLRQAENIILMFLDIFAINVFSCGLTISTLLP